MQRLKVRFSFWLAMIQVKWSIQHIAASHFSLARYTCGAYIFSSTLKRSIKRYTRRCTVNDRLLVCRLAYHVNAHFLSAKWFWFESKEKKLLKVTNVHHSHWDDRSINKVVCRRGEVVVLCPKIKLARERKERRMKRAVSRCSARTIKLMINFFPSTSVFCQVFFLHVLHWLILLRASTKKRSKQPTYKIKESTK